MRTAAALMLALALAACQSCPVPKAPEVVTVTIEKEVTPKWALKLLPEDAPKAHSVDEAKRLANSRLTTIQIDNCRRRLQARIDAGETHDLKKECERGGKP